MTLIYYKYLLAVAKYRNITNAAKELNISQSALTKAINWIEAYYGVKIFDRNAVPITTTAVGIQLLSMAEKICDMESSTERMMDEFTHHREGILRIGCPPERGSWFLPYVIADFQALHPEIKIRITEESNQSCCDSLLNGHLDLAVYAYPAFSDKLEQIILGNEPILLVMNRKKMDNYGLTEVKNDPSNPIKAPLDVLRKENIITLMQGQGMRYVATNLMERYKISNTNTIQVLNNITAVRLAAAGAGVAFTPFRSAIETCKIRDDIIDPVFLTFEEPVYQRSVFIACKYYDTLPDYVKDCIEIIKKYKDKAI